MGYVQNLNSIYKAHNATEHSYRPALKEYLEDLLPNITATNEPKRQKCGAPDYIITQNKHDTNIPIGFIEAKDIGIDLDTTENDEQLKRYRESLDNLILTDYLDFRFYKDGEKVAQAKIGEIKNGKIVALPANIASLETLLKDFAAYEGETIASAKTRAVMMARKAKLMQEVFCKALMQEEEHTALKEQLEAFRRILLHDMQVAEFADVYAQTITYGLFTARLHELSGRKFSRMEALNLIPMSNPFLRKLFQYVAVELDDSIAWIVDALCEVLSATDIHMIMSDFGKQAGRNDPIVHFYETFLAEYNPKLRKSRGVFYTPEPVVNFIIRAVDDCLKTYFELPKGLADTSKVRRKVEAQAFDKRTKSGKAITEKDIHKVQLLDVASGTGTFIAEVIKQIYHGYFEHQQGTWSNYVEEHLLPRLHGFEILMASYAMCHMKIELLLNETGYKPKDHKKPPRLGVYLTNSLEEAHPDAQTLFAGWLSAEANEASLIKKETPVMVAFGNPPYSGISVNMNIDNPIVNIEPYKFVAGVHFGEKKHWLHDDYVKFIRLGEYFIEKNGEGILAYITNHGYIDNPTFRGMRWHLLNTFDDIYILDLHGNVNKREVAPDGSPDKNVFDIQQGVAIIIAVKHGRRKEKLGRVHHADLWGTRESKYDALWEGKLSNIGFSEVSYSQPNYFFFQKNEDNRARYEAGFSLEQLFPIKSVGIVTARDHFTIDYKSDMLLKRIQSFAHLPTEDARERYELGDDVQSWQVSSAQQDAKAIGLTAKNVHTVCYRPFDNRSIFYSPNSNGIIARPMYKVMKHLLADDNIAII